MKVTLAAVALSASLLAMPVMAATQNETPKQEQKENDRQERHPVIRRAIHQLENVKMELNKEASRDFDGHRANAVKQIDEAIEQLKMALQSDKH